MKVFLIITFVSIITTSVKAVVESSFIYFDVYPRNRDQARQLKFFGQSCNVVFLNPIRFRMHKYSVNILVPSQIAEVFSEFLMCRAIAFNVEDQRLLQHKPFEIEYTKDVQNGDISFEAYNRFKVIELYLKNLILKYPGIASLENFGKSSEGRDLLAIKISSGGNGTKPLIFTDAGIHASEWLGPAQAVYIIQQLVENLSNKYLIDKVDWIIFPVVNPDGYEFTFSVSRHWRKSRSKNVNCIGTDINRNFDFYWGHTGSSPDECNQTYHGPKYFSEPETRAVKNLILKYSDQMKLYVSFHSSAQVILYPWGNADLGFIDNDEFTYLGESVALAIEKFAGTKYNAGTITELMYETSGDSISWAKGVAGIDLTYVIELPPRRGEPEVPVRCIKFVIAEVFQGMKRFHTHIEDKYVN